MQCRYRAELIGFTEEHDDEYRFVVQQEARLLDDAVMSVSTSPVWRCVSAYIHSVARSTPKPLCCGDNPEYFERLAQLGRSHDSEQLCIDWLRRYESSLRDTISRP